MELFFVRYACCCVGVVYGVFVYGVFVYGVFVIVSLVLVGCRINKEMDRGALYLRFQIKKEAY